MSEALAQAFEPHRSLLWGLCYRVTGVAADADDLVQETYLRLLRSPPPHRARRALSDYDRERLQMTPERQR